MEGGLWGIIIIVSAFMIQVLTFGTTASIGVYNIELLDHFPESSVGVSLIGSINFGVYLGSGPIVSFLMTKFGYRKIAICGSVLVAVGLAGMTFLPYISTMCFFFGVLTGFGNCCTYIPSHVLSGLYYNKYRSLATGISTSGSGLGSAVMPVLVGFLIDVYSWKGSLLFVAGLNLHLFIFASLLRYPEEKDSVVDQGLPQIGSVTEESTLDNQEETKCLVSPSRLRTEIQTMGGSILTNENRSKNGTKIRDRPKSYTSIESYQTDANYDNFGVDLRELEFIDKLSIRTNKSSTENFSDRLITSFTAVVISIEECEDVTSLSNTSENLQSHSGLAVEDQGYNKYGVKLRDKKQNRQARRTNSDSKRQSQERQRKSFLDVFYPNSPSSHSLFALGSRGSSVIYIDTFQHLCDLQSTLCEKDETSAGSVKPMSSRHFYIFTNYEFNVYFLSNIMWNAGYAIIQSFSPEFLQDKGLSLMQAAWLSGCFGLASFLGGVLGGMFGNIESINRQGLYTIACVTMGVAAFAFPIYQHVVVYILLLVISGLAFGVILGLLIVVLTDLVGVESLGNGLGYLMLSNGLGTFVGPPLASLLKEATGGFEMGIHLAGAVCILGGFMMLLMPCRQCCSSACKRSGQKRSQDCRMVDL